MQAQIVSSTPKGAVQPLVQRLANWFVPSGLLHSATNRGLGQIFVQSHILAAVAALATVVYLAGTTTRLHAAIVVLSASVIVFAALPFVLRRTENMSVVALISFQTLMISSLAGIYDYGGLSSPFLPWLLVSLMSGLFYQSRRAGLVLAIFVFDVAVFFLILLVRPPEMLAETRDLTFLSWVSIGVAMTYMAFMALYYSRITASRTELEQEAERYRSVSEELEQARSVAERVSRNRSAFLSKMSHELRTPLNAVINYSEILLEDCEDDPDSNAQRMADLGRINATGRHLLSLVSDVFDVEHLDDEDGAVDVATFTLGDLSDTVAATGQPLVEKNGNILVVECPRRDDLVTTDDKKLRQMLLNLVSNAAKFTTNGTVTVELWVERGQADDRIHAAVKDTGIGIAPDVLPQLFETYKQADPTIYSRFGGTGIGLALTRKFSILLGGEISVTSRPGQGSCFTIDIPSDLRPKFSDAEAGTPTGDRVPLPNASTGGPADNASMTK